MTYDERCRSKGTNNIISCLHYYFESIQPRSVNRLHHLILFSDSCGGKNKNQMVVSYFRWRVQMGFHKKVSWFFLEVGHTRFAPDTAGGLFGMYEKRCNHETHHELLQVINESTPYTNRNIGVAVPDSTFHDWSSLYAPFYDLKGIRKAHVIELLEHEEYRVVTRWRETYHGPWTGVRLSRLGSIHWSCLRVKTMNRKWLMDGNSKYIFEDWPSSNPYVSSPPRRTLNQSRVAHIHKEILRHIDSAKRKWWLELAPVPAVIQEDIGDSKEEVTRSGIATGRKRLFNEVE